MGKPKRSGNGFSGSKPVAANKQQVAKSSNNHAAKAQRAVALINEGKLQEAEAIYRDLIDAKIRNHTIHNNLGIILKRKGDLQGSIACYKTALQLSPSYPEAHINLGNALKEQGDLSSAIASYNAAIKLKPGDEGAHLNLGVALQQKGDLTASIDSFRTALLLKPNYPEAHNNMGNALKEKGDLTAAISCFNKAVQLNPNYPDAHINLGIALQENGSLSAALASLNTAVKLAPDYAEAHFELSMAELHGGDYTSGWKRYEYRLQCKEGQGNLNAKPSCARWTGSKISQAEQLLLVCEQGLGDTLQFMRYSQALRNLGISISLCAPAKLHTLIKQSGIDPSPLTPEQANQVTDGQWIPLLSVPRYLKVSAENSIITEPYIKTTDELMVKWRGILSAEQRPIVGINWQGNPDHEKTNSSGRSLPLETFADIANKTDATLLSLQKGFGSEQLNACSFKERFVTCQDQVNDTWDFLETAAIIANCDLVITSDTSVAHLAGGMGKTTWLLLKKVPEWRWGLEGDTTFWYPSMRLFRQKERGNWNEVMGRVAEDLTKAEHYSAGAASQGSQIAAKKNTINTNKKDVRSFRLSDVRILCISLKDAQARRQSILEMKNNLGLNLEFVDAIDGRSCSKEEIQASTSRRIKWNSLNGHRDEISKPTEAACSISHIKAWERLINEGLDQAIILEDDAFCSSNSEVKLPLFAEFAYLSTRANRNSEGEVIAPLCGAEAYYLTKSCAEKLLEINQEIIMPVDIQWLPQIESLITSKHFLTALTNEKLPTFKAYCVPGVFRLSKLHHNSQIQSNQQMGIRNIQDILAPISLGELIDKITILQIKAKHLQGTPVDNVKKELEALESTLNHLQININPTLIERLKEVNQELWQIEDNIREQERKKCFGETFIHLARSVYQQNDRRAAIKKEINIAYGSLFVEEKSYQQY